MNTVLIVQARMSSTRLPGKVLKKVLNKPLLEYMIERLSRSTQVDKVVIATTTNEVDEPIIRLCEKLQTNYFRGSESDVLSRYYHAAKAFKSDLIVRATSDCPLIDPEILDKVIDFFKRNNKLLDYASNTLTRSYPRGMDTEVLPFEILEEAYLEADLPTDREHVTPFVYRQTSRFKVGQVISETDYSHHRWTVDTPEDFELISKILESIYPKNNIFSLRDCLDLLDTNSHWSLINSEVKQKAYWE